jgi:hypothetical protein
MLASNVLLSQTLFLKQIIQEQARFEKDVDSAKEKKNNWWMLRMLFYLDIS